MTLPTPTNRKVSRFGRLALAFVLAISGLLGGWFTNADPAAAHEPDKSVIYLDIFANGQIEGEVQLPATIVAEEFGFDLMFEGNSEQDIAETRDTMAPYVAEHLRFTGVDDANIDFAMTDTELLETESGEFAVYNFELEGETADTRVFNLTYDGLMEEVDGHDAFVVIRTDFGGGQFNNEGNFLDILDAGNTSLDIDLDDSSVWKGFVGTVELGVEHILIGTDHILFVLVLLLPSVVLFNAARRWEPGTSFRSSLWRVLKIVSFFTLAHSITLTLGGLGILELPSKLVETIIALSIIAAALHNLRPVFANKEWVVAFAFGLFHGLGFAGLLSDLGLGQGQRVLSLLGFNLGVELGQMFIILLTFPILFVLRRTTAYLPLMRAGSVLLALIAAVWAVERIFEVDLGIDGWIMRFTSTPQVWALLALSMAGATGLFFLQKSQGKLIEPAAPGSADVAEASERIPVGAR